MDFSKTKFANIDINDDFFSSLKNDYTNFEEWFGKKAYDDHEAYIFRDENKTIKGFLYLKIEFGVLEDIQPQFSYEKSLKVGTLKIDPHGTRLGEKFIKKIFDNAVLENVNFIYVTIFPKHEVLITLFRKYGFENIGAKDGELVFGRNLIVYADSPSNRYPLVSVKNKNCYLLSVLPKWHSRLFPDSILNTENKKIVEDIAHSNSIHKVYLNAMRETENLKTGDVLAIYRTKEPGERAEYTSVVTSVCVVEEYKNINSFSNIEQFLKYCDPYSVFTKEELVNFWHHKRYPNIIKFTYNMALQKRLTRNILIDTIGLPRNGYYGFLKLEESWFRNIVKLGKGYEHIIID